ncbi:MAG: hypothetical protein L4877_03000 [Aigarchaeota archaeon]|nr:hypothetical protein [Candidatus Geocrenenecus dongiae]
MFNASRIALATAVTKPHASLRAIYDAKYRENMVKLLKNVKDEFHNVVRIRI